MSRRSYAEAEARAFEMGFDRVEDQFVDRHLDPIPADLFHPAMVAAARDRNLERLHEELRGHRAAGLRLPQSVSDAWSRALQTEHALDWNALVDACRSAFGVAS